MKISKSEREQSYRDTAVSFSVWAGRRRVPGPHIITTDETWLWHFDPERKAQSEVWKTPNSPPPKKARVSKSGGKHMFVFFMDRKGMILCHAVPEGQNVNAAYYSKVLRRDLVQAIRKKRQNLDSIKVFHGHATRTYYLIPV
ncbi:MAG: hypothetical protein ABW185_13045 [Sedimenticola sp.]